MKFSELREQMIEVGSLCYQRRLVAGTAGNLSTRVVDPERPRARLLMTTASGSCLGLLEPEQLVLVEVEGAHVEGQDRQPQESLYATSELPLHRVLYARYQHLGAIVHTHSPAASAYACSGQELQLLTREARVTLVRVPLVPFAPEGSHELAQAVVDAIDATAAQLGVHFSHAGAALLEQHGVVAWAGTLVQALHIADLVEHTALVGLYHGALAHTV